MDWKKRRDDSDGWMLSAFAFATERKEHPFWLTVAPTGMTGDGSFAWTVLDTRSDVTRTGLSATRIEGMKAADACLARLQAEEKGPL